MLSRHQRLTNMNMLFPTFILLSLLDVNENWITGNLPPIIGHTEEISGIFAHSNWASEDNQYLFCFDEGNAVDIAVHNISNPTSPKLLGTFQYSQSAQ